MPVIMLSNKTASDKQLEGEIEAVKFRGHQLTPISRQNNAACQGIQFLDRETYRLTVDGEVTHPLSLSYADLQAYPQVSRLVQLDCVEGWNFIAKWTGPTLKSILTDAGVKSSARTAIFHTADIPAGFSSLDLNYAYKHRIILALKDNDVTLMADRGFPFQVVAMDKFKWAKWVTRIELSADTSFRGLAENGAFKAVFCSCDIGRPWWWPFPWWPW